MNKSKKMMLIATTSIFLLLISTNVSSFINKYWGRYRNIETAYMNGIIDGIKLTMSKSEIEFEKERLKRSIFKSRDDYMKKVIRMSE